MADEQDDAAPDSTDLDKAIQLREDGDHEAAAEALGKIIDAEGPDEAEAWLWLAATWEDRKDPETAVTSYREALKLGLDDQETFGRLGLARALLDAGHADEALGVLDDTDIDEDEDETDLVELATVLHRRASRALWVLRLGPYHLTRTEIAISLLGLLCVAGTFLPWLSISYQGGTATRTAWQLTVPNAVLICCCAAALVLFVVRMTNRRLHTLWTAIVAVLLAVCGMLGAVRATLVLLAIGAVAQSYYFQYPGVDSARPHAVFYGLCAVVVLYTALVLVAFVRGIRDARRSTPHIR